jgi:ATP/ADP translocase
MVSYFIFFNEKTRYIFLQQTFKEGLLAAAPVFTYRLGKSGGSVLRRNICG